MPLMLFLIAAMLIWEPASAAVAADVPFSTDRFGSVIIPVRINGHEPVPFVLDTGSSHSVVSTSLAQRLGLPRVAKTSVLTSTGHELRVVVRITSAAIGSTVSAELLASAVSPSQISAIAAGAEGIIGQDFLRGFNYTLDYRTRRLRWSVDEDTSTGVRLPLIMRGGRYLVSLTATDDQPILLVADSGASDLVAFERDGRTRVRLVATGGATHVATLAGGETARMMLLPVLRLGHIDLRNTPTAVIARNGADLYEGDGLLPLHLFASVAINAREGYMVVRK